MTTLDRNKANPWKLKTPPGSSEFTMHVDEKDGIRLLVCTVGKTVLHYDARCVDDLLAMLKGAAGGLCAAAHGSTGPLQAGAQSEE